MNKVNELEHTYENKNLLVSLFSKLKMKIAIKLANLRKSDLILDFGCGSGWLKDKLRRKGYRVIGYDIIPHQSDVRDYREVKPSKIFAMDVFEHIPKEEIENIIRDFKSMGSNFELITAIPIEGNSWKLARRLAGKSEKIEEHITPIREILKILDRNMKQTRKINLLGISYIAKFRNVGIHR